MSLPKRYQPDIAEPDLEAQWQAEGIYQFKNDGLRPVYSIDSPPATVSGKLHIGHVYSYSHADFMARYFRMRGYDVLYPMGFDDNGLPTEHYVEKKLKISAQQIGREAFIEKCLQTSVEAEAEYRAIWDRLGLSIDWRHTYRTIEDRSRRVSQTSFIDLYKKGLAYRAQAPMIWCPTCHTAIAQADLEDMERTSEFVTLPFTLADGKALPIATTRPELLAACVAVFVHPEDARYKAWVGQKVRVPLYQQEVPVLADPSADPQKGTGAVMCCTFGDQTDVAWWYGHKLPLVEAIDAGGQMRPVTGEIAGLTVEEARSRVKDILGGQGLILGREPTSGTIRVHERCDTPVEFLVTRQWFIRVLENKQKFLELGRQLRWHPENMQARYQAWVENLNWDWCISRQRYFGVPFPVWYCRSCGEMMLADERDLPVDPLTQQPSHACPCGSTDFTPETDLMDTWATSSLTPEILTGWPDDPQRFAELFPMTLRTQGHDIIRTWTFYTIVKSWYHFGKLPWSDILISGWGVAGKGMAKISKSRGGGPMPPMDLLRRYGADAVRYWTSSTAPGKDALISEEKMQMGAKLVTKLWNVARFAEPFVTAEIPPDADKSFTPADRWILAGCQALVQRVTAAFDSYEYASAKAEAEGFFWHDLADNYLEMAKLRLYDAQHPGHAGACLALKTVLKTLLKLFAPIFPFVTDAIWRELFAEEEKIGSIHLSSWPEAGERASPRSISTGELLVAIATAARRYKSENALSLGTEIARLELALTDTDLACELEAAADDLASVTRARRVEIHPALDAHLVRLNLAGEPIEAAIEP